MFHVQEVIPLKKSKAYRSTSVKRLSVSEAIRGRGSAAVDVGLDVSKETIHVMLRWGAKDFSRPWVVENPGEVRLLVGSLTELGRDREMVVSMEPTGTYGDPFRQCMSDAGLVVHRVSPKAAHDYAEIFDGVPSQHDGKDAAIVAELSSLGKCWAWSFGVEEWEQELSYWVDWLECQRQELVTWQGRLEGLLARHWPEATRTLPLKSAVLLRSLAEYGGPSGLTSGADGREKLRTWSRGKLSSERLDRLMTEARHSVGVRGGKVAERRLRMHAERALACRVEIVAARRQLQKLCENHEVIVAQSKVVGLTTACVLWAHLGDPRDYDSAAAYRKAMGLNLTERSSGTWQGRVRISKRGPREVRRWLYMSAIRWIGVGEVKEWYAAKKQGGAGGSQAMRAIVALMRKLAPALYHAARGRPFDPRLLFPGAAVSRVAAK